MVGIKGSAREIKFHFQESAASPRFVTTKQNQYSRQWHVHESKYSHVYIMSQQPPKKFLIKPFRPSHQFSLQQAETTWCSLRSAISEIYKKNASKLSFEELYRFYFLLSTSSNII